MRNIIHFFSLLFFILTSFTLHKYYVSVMEIHPDFKQNKLEIILRTFPDDMETAMKDYNKKTGFQTDFEEFVKKYVKEKIQFAVNGKKTDYHIPGITYQDEYLIILMEVPLPQKEEIQNIYIKNLFLLDEFETQKNIVHFINNEDKKSYILNSKNKILKITL